MPTVLESSPAEYLVERSRFIGLTIRLTSPDALADALTPVRQAYPGANHYTWAYRLDESQVRASDDGEPQGTAGLPILQLLHHGRWDETLIIVIRYFGGIKLGRGGLIRAYQHCAQLALNQTVPGKTAEIHQLEIAVDYPTYERTHRAIKAHTLACHAEFAAQVILHLDIEATAKEQILTLLNQAGPTRWSLVSTRTTKKLLPIDPPT